MTTYTSWKAGDTINICASLTEFCGSTEQFIYVYDINVTRSPDPCILNIGTGGSCGLHLNNVELTFSLVKGIDGANCSVAQIYKTIGSVRTSSNGTAGITYQVTEQDRLDYISANNEGYSYYIMACITNSDGQVVVTNRSLITAPITISQNPCLGVTCPDKCYGSDLWSMKCNPLTGICVQDVVKTPNSPLCSATHYIEYDWSFLPIDFLNLVASGIVDISNVLGTDLPMPSNIVYKGATFSSGKFRVYVQYTPITASSPVKLSVAQLANMTPQALTELLQAGTVLDLDFQPTSGLQTMLILPPMDIGIFAGTIAVVIIFVAEASIISKMPGLQINPWAWGVAAAIALIGGIAGTVLGYNIVKIFDGTTTGTGTVDKPAADKTKDANTTLETELAKCLAAYPCVTAIPPTPPCSVEDTNKYDTCAKAAVLINKINTDAIAGTPSSITQADVQAILDAYSDRQTALTNGLITVQEALAQIAAEIAKAKQEAADKLAAETCGSGQIYDPSVMKCVQTADCWIAGFIPGTCMLTAKTGKTIAIIGGVVIGVYLVFSLIKK